ncbi:MAG: HAMP domain-containing histidine kinase [Clostridia bacterium]|nr:HAMP domain-containing histidine kinase [Clostridia bacterium]
MKKEKNFKKLKKSQLIGLFFLIFIILCLISETVLAIVNELVIGEPKIAYTLPLYIMPFVAGVFTFSLLYFIRRKHLKSQLLIDSMNKVAAGDYSVRINAEKADREYTKIYDNFNKMVEELSSVNTLRDDFIHTFSHELKTPLTSVNGFAGLIAEGGLSESEQKKFAQIIADESSRLLRLAENTLTLSRLENQRLVGQTEEFRLDEQLRSCIIMLERSWEQKNITVSTDLAPVTVRANKGQLAEVWLNLLSNAVKFTPEGGSIHAEMAEENGYIRVDISDTGIGIAEKDIERIFEKYYRADADNGVEGSGLGLAICKRICTLCGGEITAASKTGKGTTFTVTLPSGD